MLTNVERRTKAVESHDYVRSASMDYDDGEIVIVAVMEQFDDAFKEFVEEIEMAVDSGPKWIGHGLEVVLR